MTTDELLECILGEERVAELREQNDRFWEQVQIDITINEPHQ